MFCSTVGQNHVVKQLCTTTFVTRSSYQFFLHLEQFSVVIVIQKWLKQRHFRFFTKNANVLYCLKFPWALWLNESNSDYFISTISSGINHYYHWEAVTKLGAHNLNRQSSLATLPQPDNEKRQGKNGKHKKGGLLARGTKRPSEPKLVFGALKFKYRAKDMQV